MNVSPAFFRTAPVLRLLERAAAVAAVPLSLHCNERIRIVGWGGCEACRHVNALEKGAEACRNARAQAAHLAVTQDVAATFVCHMGFTCVSMPVLPNDGYVLTFGPYVPAECAEALEYDVMEGLRGLDESLDLGAVMPFPLRDIRVMPAGAVAAAAEWLVEALREAFDAYVEEGGATEDVPTEEESHHGAETQTTARVKRARKRGQDVWLSITALSLLCGQTRQTRAAFADMLAEADSSPETMRAELVQALAKTLDAARRLHGDVERAWQLYPGFVKSVNALDDPAALLKAAVRILRHVHPRSVGVRDVMPEYLPQVIERIHLEYTSNLELTEIARSMGVAPSSITRALESRIGLTFSGLLCMVRMAHAKRLLRETQLTAGAVGRRVGIQDQSNFGKLFQQCVGVSPGAYRARFNQ